ncbi:MAG: DoxX family membrane protein [Acidobacteria bacterium]|nr:DoxX family membrane protein [Acidobacteriota bacterium]
MRVFIDRFNQVDRAVVHFMGTYAIPFLRVALGIVYIWFGALKVSGISPVADLVEKTVYLLPEEFTVPLVGLLEIAIGMGLLFRIALRLTLFLLFLQLAGTSLVFFMRPDEAFQDGNPFVLTQTGEFVVKNLVLIAAGITIGSTVRRQRETIRTEPREIS